ncbi:5440_t:CDS:2 [Diversispora eburnea]|uniref:5440_t:CDS:1 n=1 Tax=Diversispora eburnea TaxID=1213867 RepID=A0A9N9A5Y4_9GLOM|nr:5440_t:CDS:2 [Diversispora eburnea]
MKRGTEESLYSRIDRDNVRCLNEKEPGSGKNVIKPWHERNDTTKYVESDADEQLIFFIPFTGSVKLKSISIRSGPRDQCPSKLKAFINREDVDFDTVESFTATQEWELASTSQIISYPTKINKMYNVRNITLYFPENYGDEITKISYLGFKGEWTEATSPNPADHKTAGKDKVHHMIN